MNDSRKDNFLGLFFCFRLFFVGGFLLLFCFVGFSFNGGTYKFVIGGNRFLFMKIKVRKNLNTGRRGET